VLQYVLVPSNDGLAVPLDDIEVLGLAAETKFHLDLGMDQPAECLCR
jgi:hypothetical protein